MLQEYSSVAFSSLLHHLQEKTIRIHQHPSEGLSCYHYTLSDNSSPAMAHQSAYAWEFQSRIQSLTEH